MWELINKKAKNLNCHDLIMDMSERDAIQFIQHQEGHTPCFQVDHVWVNKKLVTRGEYRRPGVEGGVYPLQCNNQNCLWIEHCNKAHFTGGHLNRNLRDWIEWDALRLNCYPEISNLSDSEAIRVIQRKEGNQDCYGKEEPLSPCHENIKKCCVTNCKWITNCDLNRTKKFITLNSAFKSESRNELFRLKYMLDILATKKQFNLKAGQVGVKIRDISLIDEVTRKMVMACPRTIFAEERSDSSKLNNYLINTEHRTVPSGSRNWIDYTTWKILSTNDMGLLRKWLYEIKPFIENNTINYWPLLSKLEASLSRGVSQPRNGPGILSEPIPVENTFEAPHIGLLSGDVAFTDSALVPLLTVDIPEIDNVSYSTLSTLMADHPEELTSFQRYLWNNLESARNSAIESESFYADCKRIERNILDDLKKLNSDYRKSKIKNSFSTTGCAVASWTLALYAIQHDSADILKVLGAGGVAHQLSSAWKEYFLSGLSLKDSPVYFLWRLDRSKRSFY